MRLLSALASAAVILLGAASVQAQNSEPTMAEAAARFLDTLEEEQRAAATLPFDSDERHNFNYVPMIRKGLAIKDMRLEQRRTAHALLRTALSAKGYLKATTVMQLEEILRAIETPYWDRDRALYYVAIFGTPSETEPWGWRAEGHHLSLNYTSVTDAVTAATPAFFGSNPAEVRTGDMTGLRVLGTEEDLARHLLSLLDQQQREKAIIDAEAPREIITGTDREARLGSFAGLPASEMTAEQQKALRRVIREYTDNHAPDLAERYLEKIERAGFDNLHFAWAGSTERGQQHYYRIHGPSILIEYDNAQNDGNHVHSVMRDPEGDFGEDILRQHYEEHPHEH